MVGGEGWIDLVGSGRRRGVDLVGSGRGREEVDLMGCGRGRGVSRLSGQW